MVTLSSLWAWYPLTGLVFEKDHTHTCIILIKTSPSRGGLVNNQKGGYYIRSIITWLDINYRYIHMRVLNKRISGINKRELENSYMMYWWLILVLELKWIKIMNEW
jgi:hypothetical protein